MRYYLLLSVFFLLFYQTHATHLRGGFISAERINGMTYRITITAYTNTEGTVVIFGGGVLDFGDGSSPHITESTVGVPRPDLGPGASVVVYTIDHNYPGKGYYTISYREANRMSGLINLPNSVEITMYFETRILIDPDQDFIIPTPLTDVFGLTCATPLNMALGLNNPGGLKIRYILQAPLQNRGDMPPGYKTPTSMKLDLFTGLLEWDGKWEGMIAYGDYVASVVAYCYKESNDGDKLVYAIRQDIQITIVDEECSGIIFSTLPLDEFQTLVVPSGTDLMGKILFQHPNQSGQAELMLYSDAPSTNLVFAQYDSISTTGKNIRVGILSVISDEGLARPEPFLVVIRGLWNSKAYSDFVFALAAQTPTNWDIIAATQEYEAPVAYPWQVDQWLTLSSAKTTTHYTLLTTTGKEIASGEYVGEHQVDCSLFASGIIIIIQQQGKTRHLQRIVKR